MAKLTNLDVDEFMRAMGAMPFKYWNIAKPPKPQPKKEKKK